MSLADAPTFLFAFVLMLGVLIFVHELGHFLVAKLFDVHVLKFSLGFGPAIGFGRWRLAFRRGETEYVAAWFPLGGFVKMLGENPDEEETPAALADPGRAFNRKPVWQRLLILVAGPAMNLLLPVVIFVGVLAVGFPQRDAVVGAVETGSPAEAAGLQAGDRITSIDGAPVQRWNEIDDALRARPGEARVLEVERDGVLRRVELTPQPRSGLDLFGATTEVGWAGLGHARPAAVVVIGDAHSPAAGTGLKSGDQVVSVAGEPVEDWYQWAERYAAQPLGSVVALEIERRGAESEAEPAVLSIDVPAVGDVERFGVLPATVLIAQVTPDAPAARAGLQAGDLIVGVDGAAVGSFATFSELVRSGGGQPVEIEYSRAGSSYRATMKPELHEVDEVGIPEERYVIGIIARLSLAPGVMATERHLNPFDSVPIAVTQTADLTRTFLEGLRRIVTGQISRKQLAGPIGIAEIAHSAFERGWLSYIQTLVLISINLGVLNLLPIPVLDGGQALLVMIEGVKRSPVSLRTREIAQQIGVTVLVALMGLAFWNDLSRKWSGFIDWLRQSAGL